MSDKTEKATPKKKRDERKKGNVAKSKDMVTALTYIGVFFVVSLLGLKYIKDFKVLMNSYLSGIGDGLYKEDGVKLLKEGVFSIMRLFLPLGLSLMTLGVVGNIAQVGFLFTNESIKPKLSKINPINGFKNMFSMTTLFNLIKSLVVMSAISYVGVGYIKNNMNTIIKISNTHTQYIGESVIYLLKGLLSKVMLVVITVGIVDLAYQYISYNKKMRMTKQEIKDEYKQQEGDPEQKAKLKRKQREISNRRMMSNVPKADVIINNPTHISVALKYERGVDNAPIVVAKGADHIAMKIRDIAKEHDIPMVENIPLARSLYNSVDIDEEIPVELYEDVGEVLIMIRKIKNRYKR